MLERLRGRVEEFCEAHASHRYDLASGRTRTPALGELFARFDDVFRPDSVTAVQRLLAGATGEEEKRARFLLEFLVAGRSAAASAPARDERSAWELSSSIRLGEELVPYRTVTSRLGETADPESRRVLEEARLEAMTELEAVTEAVRDRAREVVRELGYGSYVETVSLLIGVDLRALGREAAAFLQESDGLYRSLLADFLPRLAGVSPAEGQAADAERLRRAARWDAGFQPSGVVPSVDTLLSETGLGELAGDRLRLETVDRSGGRTLCSVLRAPEEVVVTVVRSGGRAAYARLLGEVGYGLHLACTSPELPLEERWLGDRSVSLAYGRLFRGVLASPAWLREAAGVKDGELRDLLRLSVLLELLELRGHAGRLLYELELHGVERGEELPERFAEILTGATALRHDPRYALLSAEPDFASVRHIRAAQLHAVLAGHLGERAGEAWFRGPRAASVLEPLFREGRRFTAPELSVQLASRPLSLSAVRERLEALAS